MKRNLFLSLLLFMQIVIIESQFSPLVGTLNCGQIVTGSINEGDHVYYRVTISEARAQIGFEGCNSNYDIDLSLYSETTLLRQCDDCHEMGTTDNCRDQWATDLVLNQVTAGTYTLEIGGWNDDNWGNYEVELICSTPTTPTPSPITSTPNNCDRHRKEWSTLTDNEQTLYVEAFRQLADDEVVQNYARFHSQNFDVLHNGPVFLPWHRQFVYLLETNIRNLGGDYECFALPYWDWSNEPTQSDVATLGEIPELLRTASGMGGDPNGDCVSNGPFRNGLYDPWASTCLLRDIDYTEDFSCDFYQPSQVMNEIDVTNDYGEFRTSFERTPHSRPHNCIGGHMSSGASPDDPWFYLHHCFVDYVFALWQDCNNYDGVSINEVTNRMYNGNVLSALPGFSNIRAGDVLDISSMGVSYEKGPFWENAGVDDDDNCGGSANPINSEWFKDTQRRRRLMKGTRERRRKSVEGDSRDISMKIKEELKTKGHRGKELVHLWSVKVCQHEQKQSGNVCEIPNYFEDCSKMPLNEEMNDIDITLDELLNKKGITDCMKKIRLKFYNWAKMTHSLKALCNGCYDRFCDKSVLRDKCDKCEDNRYKNISYNIEELETNHIEGFLNPNDLNSIHVKNNNNNNDDEAWKSIEYSSQFKFVFITSLFIILMVINICICFVCCNKHRVNGYKKVVIQQDVDEESDDKHL